MKFLHSNEDCSISEKPTSPTIRRRENATFSGFQYSIMPFQKQLKFMMLCRFFTLHDAKRAVAGSDIASQLQSIASLGDISTGFASVRKISL
jgi:hypothetical protein